MPKKAKPSDAEKVRQRLKPCNAEGNVKERNIVTPKRVIPLQSQHHGYLSASYTTAIHSAEPTPEPPGTVNSYRTSTGKGVPSPKELDRCRSSRRIKVHSRSSSAGGASLLKLVQPNVG